MTTYPLASATSHSPSSSATNYPLASATSYPPTSSSDYISSGISHFVSSPLASTTSHSPSSSATNYPPLHIVQHPRLTTYPLASATRFCSHHSFLLFTNFTLITHNFITHIFLIIPYFITHFSGAFLIIQICNKYITKIGCTCLVGDFTQLLEQYSPCQCYIYICYTIFTN